MWTICGSIATLMGVVTGYREGDPGLVWLQEWVTNNAEEFPRGESRIEDFVYYRFNSRGEKEESTRRIFYSENDVYE